MNMKTGFIAKQGNKNVVVVDGNEQYKVGIISIIVFEDDSIGTVMIISSDEKQLLEILNQGLLKLRQTFWKKIT